MSTPRNVYRQMNTNYGLVQAGSHGAEEAGVGVGVKDGFPSFFRWDGLQFSHALGNPLYVAHWDDFTGVDATLTRYTLNGSGGSQTAQAVAGGALRLTTGGTDTNLRTLTVGLNWLVSRGWTFFEARVASVSSIATRVIEIGLSDAVSETNGMAFSTHTASAPVDVADNAAIFGYDTNASGNGGKFAALSVNGGTPTGTLTTVAPVAGTYNTFRVGIDESGNAYFWADGVLVATHALAVATSSLLTPWLGVVTRTGGASSIDVDYFGVFGNRV